LISSLKDDLSKPFRKHKKCCSNQEGETNQVSPVKAFLHYHHCKDSKNYKGNYFLNYFKLEQGKSANMANTVGRDRQAVFDESDQPAYYNRFP